MKILVLLAPLLIGPATAQLAPTGPVGLKLTPVLEWGRH
jgi:hypothetical protein